MPIPVAILNRDDVFHSVPHMTLAVATQRMRQIERRDLNGIAGLQGDAFELAFFQENATRLNRYEWGIARDTAVVNPDCILVAGNAGGVQWAPFLNAGLVPLAHSHPFHRNGSVAASRAIVGGSVPWDDINGVAAVQNTNERLRIFPSAGDAAFCSHNGLANHRVETPYVVVTSGAGMRHVANPDAHHTFALAPRLNFIINAEALDHGPAHTRISLTALQGGQTFWFKRNIYVAGYGGEGLTF